MHLSPAARIAAAARSPGLPDRLFMAASHRDVAAALDRGLARPGSVIAVTGDAGLGKTILVDAAVTGLAGRGGVVRQIRGTSGDGLLLALQELTQPVAAADETGMSEAGPAHGPGVLVIDDAHDLAPDVLERFATMLESGGPGVSRPNIVFVARPEFWTRLGHPRLARLRDRIDVCAVLFPMVYAEAEAYIEHLFQLAGGPARAVLSEEALHALVLRAQGNLRQINAELDRALAAGGGHRWLATIRNQTVPQEAPQGGGRSWKRPVAVMAALVTVALAGAAVLMPDPWPQPRTRPASRPTPPPSEERLAAPAPTAPAPSASPAPVLERPAPPPAAIAVPLAEPKVPPVAPPDAPAPAPEQASKIVAAPPTPASPTPAAPTQAALPSATPPPAAPAPAAAAATPKPDGNLPDAVVAALLRRGDAMLELRDISAARRLYERAAMAGSARGALLLGGTYDPTLRSGAVWDAEPDAGAAAAWYQLAAKLGDAEARSRLRRLPAEVPAR